MCTSSDKTSSCLGQPPPQVGKRYRYWNPEDCYPISGIYYIVQIQSCTLSLPQNRSWYRVRYLILGHLGNKDMTYKKVIWACQGPIFTKTELFTQAQWSWIRYGHTQYHYKLDLTSDWILCISLYQVLGEGFRRRISEARYGQTLL